MNSLKNILIGIAHVKYSEDDWGNNYEVKTITSVEDQIVNYFTDYDFNAQFDIDRVSDYYLISKICQMESLKDKIIDNDIIVNVLYEYKSKYGGRIWNRRIILYQELKGNMRT